MSFSSALTAYRQGGVIAYPTEAVFGLGCDPDNDAAIQKLLAIKQRPKEKGLILLAGDYAQLQPYLDESTISAQQKAEILSRWPGAITQIMPAKSTVSSWVKGSFDSIAVRVTEHPDVIDLCRQTGKPIISTSANLTGQPSLCDYQQVVAQFQDKVDFILEGKTLGFSNPSTIINALSGEILRP
ncbi:L-threonylcarbamoyladenylate synthase [Thalassomonas actiniarum]|uniref:Threonylcarbamoyl-AMP synthase n=1 Tax=Thalassomonas actiniarum TaxID=485447 RepID=A0AAE9YQS8_9GAMM|nr:L-threonylcarbamoyladenylate synthase [Thalassomonas actiniarum]WDD99136.1 threonylcarbamoyl-AMP synthase [Thalassomonas actiniarum]